MYDPLEHSLGLHCHQNSFGGGQVSCPFGGVNHLFLVIPVAEHSLNPCPLRRIFIQVGFDQFQFGGGHLRIQCRGKETAGLLASRSINELSVIIQRIFVFEDFSDQAAGNNMMRMTILSSGIVGNNPFASV